MVSSSSTSWLRECPLQFFADLTQRRGPAASIAPFPFGRLFINSLARYTQGSLGATPQHLSGEQGSDWHAPFADQGFPRPGIHLTGWWQCRVSVRERG
jgi:hypothetical protein